MKLRVTEIKLYPGEIKCKFRRYTPLLVLIAVCMKLNIYVNYVFLSIFLKYYSRCWADCDQCVADLFTHIRSLTLHDKHDGIQSN